MYVLCIYYAQTMHVLCSCVTGHMYLCRLICINGYNNECSLIIILK